MNFNLLFNRCFILIDSLFRGKVLNKKKKEINTKNIIIVFQQIFGDSIAVQDSLKEYVKLYPQEKGYKIIMLARPGVSAFMRDTLILPKEIDYQVVDFKKFLESYRYYREIVKKYDKVADMLIVPGTSVSAEIFCMAVRTDRKIALGKSHNIEKKGIEAYLRNHTYDELIRPEKELMMLQRHRLLLNYLGDSSYKAKLPNLLPKQKIIMERQYCVMCLGASKTEKCWPTERFAEVADYIIEHYDMNIHLSGGADELKYAEAIMPMVKHPDRVISHIGKTNFSDWSAIVQHAELVIGNDSATVHLAAAARRKTVCITGVYDKYLFYPYKVDELAEGDCLPVAVMNDFPCALCRTIGYNAGYGNSECKKRISDGKCTICIESITVGDVLEQVDKLMKEEENEIA
jgi:ADP-heptose:LPS heptosyltransferase